MAKRPRRPQPLLIRLTHWINVPAFVVMAMSGLQIWMAYPFFGPRGAQWDWVPLAGWMPPEWMRAGHWLAGARHLHFAFAWLLVLNAIVYLSYLAASGQWRRRLFWPPRDTRPAIHQLLYYLRIRKQAPPSAPPGGDPRREEPPVLRTRTGGDPSASGLYNGLQRSAYTFALVLGILEVLSGLAVWKPVQLRWLASMFGGYDGARVVHFLALIGLLLFLVAHVIMAVVHWRQSLEMITGGRRHEET